MWPHNGAPIRCGNYPKDFIIYCILTTPKISPQDGLNWAYYIFTNPSMWAEYDTKSILQVEFNRFELQVFFFLTIYHTKV